LNVQRKNAAVTRLLPLISGKSEQEVRELLAADEKKFTSEEIDEIYQALLNPEPTKTVGKYQVNFGVYVPEHRRNFSKEEIEADQDIMDYLVDIKSGAVSIIKEGK